MRRKRRSKYLFVFLAFLIIVFVWKTASFYPVLLQLIFNRGINLQQTDNRVNVLLLGIGGGNHEGPNLTDTIIFASLDSKNDKVALVSIPRDLWFPKIKLKINDAYANGQANGKGGLKVAEYAVGEIVGQKINYAIRIDFSGFVRAVDIVGGLDINVDNTFDDYGYPIDGKEDDSCGYSAEEIKAFTASVSAESEIWDKFSCRYRHLHFTKGPSHMNGETALEYVRSRHAFGFEGTDFARSKRQQKTIQAFKDKIFSAQTLANPTKLIGLYETLKDSIDTDIKKEEFDDFIRLAQKLKKAKVQSAVLDTGDETTNRAGLLTNPPITKEYDYTWVLIPIAGNGNFSQIQKYVVCEITKGNCRAP